MQLYIHIPFCQSKCPYCAFGSFDDKFNLVKRYFKALNYEIKNSLNAIDKIDTVFIGGGTPSSVNAQFYEEIFQNIRSKLTKFAEITIEANPNSATIKWLETIKKIGVNRISFGAQSFDEKKLKLLGRAHCKNAIIEAVQNAKITGFKNINIDLMYGTKLDTKKLLENEIINIKKLQIHHVSAYSLTLEENTPFYNKFNLKKDSLILAKFMIKLLQEAGFKQYEISNFGRKCKHNLGYWKQKNYLGFGAYSVGSIGTKRVYSPQNIEEYINNPLKKRIEILSNKDRELEAIFLGLRSVVGIKISSLSQEQKQKVQLLKRAGKIEIIGNRIYNKNFLIADEIFLFLT